MVRFNSAFSIVVSTDGIHFTAGCMGGDVWEAIREYTAELVLKPYAEEFQVGEMFRLSRVVEALATCSLESFFRAGLSLAAGVRNWDTELVAHARGSDTLQNAIQQVFPAKDAQPAAGHVLASLNQPVYITLNYGTSFENVWLGTNSKRIEHLP